MTRRDTSAAAAITGRKYAGQSPDERRRSQRERLLRAAIDAFAELGFPGATVERIVSRARTSRAAFYVFFANREECLHAAYREAIDQLMARVLAIASEAPAGADLVEVGVGAYVRGLVGDPAAARVILIEAVGASPELERARADARTQFAGLIRTAWRRFDRDTADSPEAEAISVGLVGALGESMVHLASTGRLHEAPAHVGPLVRLLHRAFSPGILTARESKSRRAKRRSVSARRP